MVVRIRSGKSIKGAINYNEKKVNEGKAELIAAKSYAKDLINLNFHEKLNRLQQLADLNTRAETNCLHVSLNFDISESHSNEKLEAIAEAYMEGIGFGKQPYLVYHHSDAAHQHIHIVSTNIQRDGKRISMHNLGRVQSEKTRKEIEVNFKLVKAGDKLQNYNQPLRPVNLTKVQYGKSATKQAISNIVNQVVSQYKFASLPELNAILKLYNVTADRGAEQTRMFEKGGLQYSLVDEKGNKVGVPIKASSIYNKPTLKELEKKFTVNEKAKQSLRQQLKDKLDSVLAKSKDRNGITNALQQLKIDIVWRNNVDNFLYGVTYIDHYSKTVFNGSELGKEYSAAALREVYKKQTTEVQPGQITPTPRIGESAELTIGSNKENLFDELTRRSSSFDNQLPYELKKKRRRKQRKI